MGSCVSLQKSPEAALKLRLSFTSKNDKLVNPSPLVPAVVKSQPSTTPPPDFGSKDEKFFDSKPWLESDCDDDFFSVNGDFTPSRGNTPVHHKFSIGVPQANRNHFSGRVNYPLEASPVEKKKRLSELFSENAGDEVDGDEQNVVGGKRSTTGTPYVAGANSGCSSERSANGTLKTSGQKSHKSPQCCLPRLRSSRSFSERRKRMSPVATVGG